MTDIRTKVIDLMNETGAAHHRAFEAVDGADREWPIWYADFVYPRLKDVLPADFTRSALIYALFKADKAYKVEKPSAPWPEYYADLLLTEFTG